ncbi:hypothetical protein F5Y10DRAFT_272885 [Nemania abortiva]|nr:hypothetical protein F5Y10DRAFT_272885 [Nemania abortiva]
MRITSYFTTIALGFVVQDLPLARAAGKTAWALGTVGQYQANNCGDSTFNVEKSSVLPLKKDCEDMFQHFNDGRTGATSFLVRGGGDQTANNDDSHYWAFGGSGTCAFGVKASGDGPIVMSYGDTADLIRDSIDHHSTGDYVRTSGDVECTGTPDIVAQLVNGKKKEESPQKVSWQIYNPADKSLKTC